MPKFFAFAAAAFLALASCTPSASRWEAFQNTFIERSFELDPVFGAYQGRHEFDGRLPDWSEQGIATAITFLRDSIKRPKVSAV